MALKLQRTFGKVNFNAPDRNWVISEAEPHVCIKIKAIFTKIALWKSDFVFADTPENCFELLWFIDRFPLLVSPKDMLRLNKQKRTHIASMNELGMITLPTYRPNAELKLNPGETARAYQLIGRDLLLKTRRLLIGDDTGLGKTAIAVFSALSPGTVPAFVCVQTHMPDQWKAQVEKFTQLRVHIVKRGPVYSLPPADVYIITYSKLGKWIDIFAAGFFKLGVFDEAQELRHHDSLKYRAAKRISESCQYVLGLTATPIYNYGDEIFNILELIKPGCLGKRDEFLREWSTGVVVENKIKIKDPVALGSYLRESFLFLRRTRKEVNRELPEVNTIVHTVGYDNGEVIKAEDIARQLAQKTLTGSFVERGQAARELDMFLRQKTGLAKAREVAQYVRILLENNEPVILAGWHREVYDIWMEELEEFSPVMFTGSESPAAKAHSKRAFLEGQTNLFIISLRSGVGLDGLQARCSTVVFGELDWSPMVHHQVISRADRDGQKERVTAIYLVTEYGSDPTIIELNGVKASLSKSIVDPLEGSSTKYSDESRIKLLATQFLERKRHA